MNFKDRRIGIFRIDSIDVENQPEKIADIFAQLRILPLRVEYRRDYDAFEYTAISERFEELEKGMPAPEYELWWNRESSDIISGVEVKKI